MITNPNLKKIISKVSEQTGIPEIVVNAAYISFWKFTKDVIADINFRQIETEEDLNSLRTSINIPSLGKLYTTMAKIEGQRKRYEYIQKLKEKINEGK